jgi:hypothetical protein
VNARILPPNMPWPQALRAGYVGEIRMPGYLAWLRTLPCHRCMTPAPSEASHPNFYKSQVRKGPDPLALPECRYHHEAYEAAGDPQEASRLARAALFMLQAISEGRLVWKSL